MLIMDLQHFGGGGSSSGAQGSSGMTDEQVKAVMRIVNRTRAYKNEQYRVINEAGEVVLEKRGDAESVGSTMGEKRDNLPGAVHKRYEQARDAEIRRIEVKPYHDFYRKNAHKYGFRYTFVKAKK